MRNEPVVWRRSRTGGGLASFRSGGTFEFTFIQNKFSFRRVKNYEISSHPEIDLYAQYSIMYENYTEILIRRMKEELGVIFNKWWFKERYEISVYQEV